MFGESILSKLHSCDTMGSEGPADELAGVVADGSQVTKNQ